MQFIHLPTDGRLPNAKYDMTYFPKRRLLHWMVVLKRFTTMAVTFLGMTRGVLMRISAIIMPVPPSSHVGYFPSSMMKWERCLICPSER